MKSKQKVVLDSSVKQTGFRSSYNHTKVAEALSRADAFVSPAVTDANSYNFSELSNALSVAAGSTSETTWKAANSTGNVVPMDNIVDNQAVSSFYNFSELQEALNDTEEKILTNLKVRRVCFARRARLMEFRGRRDRLMRENWRIYLQRDTPEMEESIFDFLIGSRAL